MILLAAVTKVPVYEKGVAIVVTDDCDAPGLKKHLQLAVFLSPESLPFLKKEERILIKTERDNQLSNTSIVTFMPEVLSPSQLQMRFPLVPSVAAQIKGPKVMAMVNMELPSSSVACSNHMGSIYQVQYEIGERRLLTILF